MSKENESYVHNGILFRLVSEISSFVTIWIKLGDVLFNNKNRLRKGDISLNVICVWNLAMLNLNKYRVE